jgi:hypothetical protein
VQLVIHQLRISEPEREWLWKIPECESSWEPEQNNSGGAEGLYQFEPETWAELPSVISRHSVLSAYWNARGAAVGYRQFGPGAWECTGILGLG